MFTTGDVTAVRRVSLAHSVGFGEAADKENTL